MYSIYFNMYPLIKDPKCIHIQCTLPHALQNHKCNV